MPFREWNIGPRRLWWFSVHLHLNHVTGTVRQYFHGGGGTWTLRATLQFRRRWPRVGGPCNATDGTTDRSE